MCDISTKGFLIEILLHIYNAQQTEVISGFLFTLFTQKLSEHLVGEYFWSEFILFPNTHSKFFLTLMMSRH